MNYANPNNRCIPPPLRCKLHVDAKHAITPNSLCVLCVSAVSTNGYLDLGDKDC
jgi:hypothetical protein